MSGRPLIRRLRLPSLGHRFETDGVSHLSELVDGAVLGFVGVAPGIEVVAGVGGEGAGLEHVPNGTEPARSPTIRPPEW